MIKLLQEETQKYENIADEKSDLINSMMENNETESIRTQNLEKELENLKKNMEESKTQDKSQDEQVNVNAVQLEEKDVKKEIKEKEKEIKKLKEEIVRYKEKLESSLADLNTAKNEKRQLCNYLDDVKR